MGEFYYPSDEKLASQSLDQSLHQLMERQMATETNLIELERAVAAARTSIAQERARHTEALRVVDFIEAAATAKYTP